MKTGKMIVIFSCIFAAAAALALYPFFANIHNNRLSRQLIAQYEQSVSQADDDENALMLEAAAAWNAELYTLIEPSYFPDGLEEDEIYESLLNANGDGMMGYVVIPKINVSLAVYHYTTDEILLKGAGHMEASALPVGGEGTRCVITAHRGLPSAAMFTDLDELEEGDVFYIKVCGETLAYEVCEISVVDPDETASLMPESGRDLCTLVTCTPYGINTKRLLVTGERTEYDEEAYESAASQSSAAAQAFKADYILVVLAGCEAAVYAAALVFTLKRNRKRQKKNA